MAEENDQKKRSILTSLKEISSYLDRNIRTCQRWEKELALPVYRMDDFSRAKVFSFQDELDEWLASRIRNNEIGEKSFFERKGAVLWTISGLSAALAVVAVLSFYFLQGRKQDYSGRNPTRFHFHVDPIRANQKYYIHIKHNELSQFSNTRWLRPEIESMSHD